MKASLLVPKIRKVAEFNHTGTLTKWILLAAASTLEQQQQEVNEMRENRPVRCGECLKRPICRMWERRHGEMQIMGYTDYCSHGKKNW